MTFPLRYFLTADKLAPDSHNTAPSAINIINEPCFAIHFQSLFLCVYIFFTIPYYMEDSESSYKSVFFKVTLKENLKMIWIQ